MSPSCCKGRPAESCTITASKPLDESPPISKLEIGDNCCIGKEVEPPSQGKPRNSVEHTKTVSPCSQCDDSSSPDQPCCDESCMVRLAVRECDDSCGSGGNFTSISSSHEDLVMGDDQCQKAARSTRTKIEPCQYHIESVKSRFQPTLDALGCICRALYALSLESCCVSGKRKKCESRRSGARISSARHSSARSLKCTKSDSRYYAASPKICDRLVENDCPSTCSGSARDSSCGKSEPSILSTSCAKKCYGAKSEPAMVATTSDNCCSESSGLEKKEVSGPLVSKLLPDLEKGLEGGEHVILSIQGMTCTGCELKLERTLTGIAGVSNVKTSLTSSRTEFDVNTAKISIDEAVARLQKATGFACQRLSLYGHELEVLTLSDSEKLLEKLPPGILSIDHTTDATFRIAYDPHVIGARDIVENAFDQQLELAPNRPDISISAGNKHVWQAGLASLVSACLTVPVLVMAWAPLPKREITYGSVSLVLATIIQMFIAGPFYIAALKSLIFARLIEMDLLIVLSTSVAYIFSVIAFALQVAGKPLSTGEFFETSTLLVTLITLGRFITALARQKAIESISIRSLQQSTATLVDSNGMVTRNIDVSLLQYGDVFRVMPEAKVITDGTVISGKSEVDESLITGESTLVTKTKGSPVIAGAINGSGTMDVRLTRLCDDNTISAISHMVDEAKLSKPKTQEIADRVAGLFVPVVIVISIITFIIWIAVGIAVRRQSRSDATIQAVTYAVAVLIISCPCAIGLAVPMVIVIAGGVAANNGVIFKSADTIEVARNVTHVVFDKTGTLTKGHLSVRESKYINGLSEDVKPILLGLVSGIKHPVSQAITKHLQFLGVSPAQVLDIHSLPGKGVLGSWDGNEIRAGNASWTQTTFSPEAQQLLVSDSTVLCFTINNTLRAMYALQDTLRPEAAHVVSTLQAKGVSVSIVSGDEPGSVKRTAETLGIPSPNALSRQSPADKAAYIKALKASFANSTILFLGDGTNDAIALAAADIGVHMSEGTDVARSAADVVLVHADLRGVLVLMELSRKVSRRIMFNFAWSFAYNLFAILLAAGAFVRFRVPPAFAGVGEIVSVLPVIAVAVGLRGAKFPV